MLILILDLKKIVWYIGICHLINLFMKKNMFAVSFLFCALFTNAQNALYQDVITLITRSHPEISTDNKLIAINVWSIDNSESREANKSFEKAYKVYEHALLKGGNKGIVVVSLNKENLSEMAVISYQKDGVAKVHSFKISELEAIDQVTSNVVFDSNGNEVSKNLSSQAIFTSIQHLITR